MQEQLRVLLQKVEEKDGCGPQEALRDILTDLRHIAKKDGLDFDFAGIGSEEVFDEEIGS